MARNVDCLTLRRFSRTAAGHHAVREGRDQRLPGDSFPS